MLLSQAERRAIEAKHEFDHVSKLIKSEVARFERERIEDFKTSLQDFLEGTISRQTQVCHIRTPEIHPLMEQFVRCMHLADQGMGNISTSFTKKNWGRWEIHNVTLVQVFVVHISMQRYLL
jgi:hypothetical protein